MEAQLWKGIFPWGKQSLSLINIFRHASVIMNSKQGTNFSSVKEQLHQLVTLVSSLSLCMYICSLIYVHSGFIFKEFLCV